MRVMDFTGRSTATLEIEFSLPAELLNTAFAYTWTEARDTLEADPSWFDEVRTAASPDLEALRRWGMEVFAARADEARAVLTRDVEAKRRLAGTMPMEDLIELATNGLEYTPQPGVRRVILVPHIALRPWNILDDDGDTYIINYPVADESLQPDRSSPPAKLLRLYRALDDEKRLRILRRLASSSASLQELAGAAGVAKSTAHHHLVILRSAGLVRTSLEPKGRYSIRPEAVAQSSGWLEGFLEGRDA